jgi:hypothetical protein
MPFSDVPEQDRSEIGHGHWSAVYDGDGDDVGSDVAHEFGHRLVIEESRV